MRYHYITFWQEHVLRGKHTCIGQHMTIKGLFTPSDYITVTVTLTGGIFDLFGKIKGAECQRCCGHNVITWCEWALTPFSSWRMPAYDKGIKHLQVVLMSFVWCPQTAHVQHVEFGEVQHLVRHFGNALQELQPPIKPILWLSQCQCKEI